VVSLGSAALGGDAAAPRVNLPDVSVCLFYQIEVRTCSIILRALRPFHMSLEAMLSWLHAPRCLDASERGGWHNVVRRTTGVELARYAVTFHIDHEHTLRRPSGEPDAEPIEASEPRRSASCLGASGIAGTGLSPNTLWLWDEYFWWNGEGIMRSV
jgi:hypothetical protein